jgi:predicted short-subunit dehydrogenase-like oxidoreductase (DUF2520 family)
MQDPRIGIVGIGRVGATLATALARAGYDVAAIYGRRGIRTSGVRGAAVATSAQGVADRADLVLLTVSDDAVEEVCGSVRWRPGQAVVHCSGARELDALASARDAGARVGAFHPLQMFATPEAALATLPGCVVTIDADDELAPILERIAERLGCRPMRLTGGRRALYHASAYYVGPFLLALIREAAAMWATFGRSEREALDALTPLLRGTVAAALEGGIAQGMGGCVARGDAGTVERHLLALEAFSPEAAQLYRQLALRTIPLALERGTLPAAAAGRIRALLARGGDSPADP